MTEGHHALVVEDDKATAEDLVEILASLGCRCVVASNKRDALAALSANSFCLVLLDLEIKAEPGSNKGHSEHGHSLLRQIRRAHSVHTGQSFWLPVVIVSGFAREVAVAVELMRDGANDVVQKPVNSRLASEAIRRVLETSGRAAHDLCSKQPESKPPDTGTRLSLTIPGNRDRRRTHVALSGRSAFLTDSSLKVLLHLAVAHLQGKVVHKRDLGATQDQGFKGISVLREALKPVLGGDFKIIENHYHGNYSLSKNVVIGSCDTDKLLEIGDRTITRLARELRSLLDSVGSKV